MIYTNECIPFKLFFRLYRRYKQNPSKLRSVYRPDEGMSIGSIDKPKGDSEQDVVDFASGGMLHNDRFYKTTGIHRNLSVIAKPEEDHTLIDFNGVTDFDTQAMAHLLKHIQTSAPESLKESNKYSAMFSKSKHYDNDYDFFTDPANRSEPQPVIEAWTKFAQDRYPDDDDAGEASVRYTLSKFSYPKQLHSFQQQKTRDKLDQLEKSMSPDEFSDFINTGAVSYTSLSSRLFDSDNAWDAFLDDTYSTYEMQAYDNDDTFEVILTLFVAPTSEIVQVEDYANKGYSTNHDFSVESEVGYGRPLFTISLDEFGYMYDMYNKYRDRGVSGMSAFFHAFSPVFEANADALKPYVEDLSNILPYIGSDKRIKDVFDGVSNMASDSLSHLNIVKAIKEVGQ